VKGGYITRVRENGDKGPSNGGPEGNNHSDVEEVWKYDQILLSVLGELINSQHAPHQSPFHWARLLRLLNLVTMVLEELDQRLFN
jgi:hypothetical protein